MITPSFLSAASDQVMKLYAQLETDIKVAMCKRLAQLGKITDATKWQAKILAQVAPLSANIDAIIAKYDRTVQVQIKQLFARIVQEIPKSITDNQKQMLSASAGYDSLIVDLANITKSSTATSEFLSVANAMYMKASSGAFSYQEAIKDAVDEMASKGLTTLKYSDRPRSVESVARSCVLTSLGQAAGSQSLQNAEDTGTDLVVVSAHMGARHTDNPQNPWSNHDEWQGKVFCLSGERDYTDENGNTKHAPNFYTACGYGEADGICGINRRHTFYPYYEGLSTQPDNEELKDYRRKDLELDGRKVSRYEVEQAMRGCERRIREWKRKADCQNVAGLDNSFAMQRLQHWQSARQHISKQTGIPADYAREYIGKVK